jgi:hypothetical protein
MNRAIHVKIGREESDDARLRERGVSCHLHPIRASAYSQAYFLEEIEI